MAVRGRKPKPADLRLMAGNAGKRPIPESVGDFDGLPVLPAWVDEKAPAFKADFLGEWNRVTRQLEAWGVMGEVNQGGIEGLCAMYAQFVQASKNGDATEARQSYDAYRKALNEFGLTPACKGRVSHGNAKPKASKLSKYTAG
jgi:phage terminase small subunit